MRSQATAAELLVECLENEGSVICCPVDYSTNLELASALGEIDESLS